VNGSAVNSSYWHDAAAGGAAQPPWQGVTIEAPVDVGGATRGSVDAQGLRVRLCASPVWGGRSRAVNLTYGGREETLVVTPHRVPGSCPAGSYRRPSPALSPPPPPPPPPTPLETTPEVVDDVRATGVADPVAAGAGFEATGEWCALCPAGTAFTNVADTAANTSSEGTDAAASSASANLHSAREAIVGLMACVPCPEGFISAAGATRCVSCGAVFNSNRDSTACEVRWYVYVGISMAVALVAIALATAQTLFRFGNRHVERLMWQAREAGRLQREREKRKRERAVKTRVRRLDSSGGGGGGDSSSDEDEEGAAVRQEVSSTLDMVLAEAAIASTAIAAVDAMAASASTAAALLTGADRKALSAAIKAVVAAQKLAVEVSNPHTANPDPGIIKRPDSYLYTL